MKKGTIQSLRQKNISFLKREKPLKLKRKKVRMTLTDLRLF